jgi:cell division protein FtsI (penicillin-binding protein 3)
MKPLVSRWIRVRLGIVALTYFVGLLIVLARAFHLQVLDRSHLAALAERQHTAEIRVAPRRGPIYDRRMQELAVSVDVDSIYARPGEMGARSLAASRLASALDLDAAALRAKLAGRSPFVWVKRRATPDEADAVRALHIPGVGFVKEGRRYYPHRNLAAKVIGFVGTDAQGLEGLERHFDGVLRGKLETRRATRDALQRSILDRDAVEPDAEDAHGLVLSIDHAIQYIAETEIAAAVKKARARHGIAIVMDPRTGDILALAEAPGFNPNVYAKAPVGARLCRSFASTFEPGSTFKVFVVAAALEAGAIRPRDHFYCENGAYPFAGRVIHDVHPYGWLDVGDIVKHSSNIGALKIADRLGKDRMYRYIRDFGFGRESGTDFPGDLPGLLPGLPRWSRITQGTVAFGQGIAVTPIQITAAIAAIANGGVLMRPRLVLAEVDGQGRPVRRFEPRPVRRVVSGETARIVTGFMKAVTLKGGTGEAARAPSYIVAGKTGTAQKIEEGIRGYSRKRVGSFVGFAPADDPRLAISVIIDEPQGIPYGGVVAAPAFRGIAEKALTYLSVPPDPLAQELEKARSKKLPALEVGAPLPPRARRAERARDLHGGAATPPVPAVTNVALGAAVPDFAGMSVREALKLARANGVQIDVAGTGIAVKQAVPPGTPVEPGQVILVTFSPPERS